MQNENFSDSLIQRALTYSEKEKDLILSEFGTPNIVLVGVGGAGNNIIHRIMGMTNEISLETIAIDTDKKSLDLIRADKKILIGKQLVNGLGTSGCLDVGEQAAWSATGTLNEVLKKSDMVIICAGMGGGTGSGASPIIAKIAKENGAVVIAIVHYPFKYISKLKLEKATLGILKLRTNVNAIIINYYDKLIEQTPHLPNDAAYTIMNQIIAETIIEISENITKPSLINLDWADLKLIFGGSSEIGTLIFSEENLDNFQITSLKSLSFLNYRDAKSVIISITGGPDMTLSEAEEIAEAFTYELDSQSNVIWGSRIKKEYEGKVKILAIATSPDFDDKFSKNKH